MTAPRLRAAALVAASLTLLAADWTRFRGPNGTGISADKDIPLKWSTTENVIWKTLIPGVGNSSPIVSEGKIFLQTASKDGAKRSLLCLNAADGKELWSYDAPGRTAPTHAKNTLASSTPAADGERVYSLFWDGKALTLVACDYAGKQLWTADLGPFAGNHGAGHSPAVYDGKVFVHNDQDDKSAVLAFDAETGKELWRAERDYYAACYGTPIMRKTDVGQELVIASTAGVAAYDPDTGEPNWQWTWARRDGEKALRMVGTPLVHGDLVYAYTGDGGGSREMVAVRAGADLPAGTDRLAWQLRRGTPYVPNLLSYGDYLFGIHDAGQAYCYEPKTGEIVWQERLTGGFTSSPVIIDGKIYATNEAGSTFVFPAEAEFELLAENHLEERVFATPAVADGRLYIRTATQLYCIGK